MKKVLVFVASFAASMSLMAQNNPFGIGTYNPLAQLHIHQSVEEEEPPLPLDPNPGGRDLGLHNYITTFLMTNTNSPSLGFEITQYNNDVTLSQREHGFLKLQTPGGEFILTRTGRFGFGDTISTHIFNVQGTARFGSAVKMTQSLTVDGTLSTGGALTVGGSLSTVGSLTVGDLSQGPGGMTVNGHTTLNNGLTVNSSSTLHGITTLSNAVVGGTLSVGGNTTLTGSLTVGSGFHCDASGGLKVKYLKVTLTDWPDYVFGGGHTLMPLDELEAYVGEHSHLPGVPSAAEVEEQGADLGEMNKVLMEKVEELTLYIIDLQKQINELKSNK